MCRILQRQGIGEPQEQSLEGKVGMIRRALVCLAKALNHSTAILDPSHICELSSSLSQCCILNPLRESKDRTCIMDASQAFTPEPQWELLQVYNVKMFLWHWNVLFIYLD